MSTVVARPRPLGLPARLVVLLRDVVFGTLLCLSPLTALIALGWLTRHMRAVVEARWGDGPTSTAWILGARDAGAIGRLVGGAAANIREGIRTAICLAVACLPFGLIWLGAWWAGWENSFNKGYEQAAIGPVAFVLGIVLALPILAHLPFALAHLAVERRLSAFFELRLILSVRSAAGWRSAWLALASVLLSVPLFAMRAVPVFIEDIVPGFAAMPSEAQMQVGGIVDLAAAALAFCAVLHLRSRAAIIYADAFPRAAADRPSGLWAGHAASRRAPTGRAPGRLPAAIWFLIACSIWIGLPILIVVGQFMNYEPVLWLTHPVFLLPWPG